MSRTSTSDIIAWADESSTKDDDWERESARQSAAVRPWPDAPKGVLYGTKASLLWRMLPELAPGFSTYTMYGPPPPWLAALVAADPASKEDVIFVGDLDPLDLLSLATLMDRAKLDPERVYFAGPVDPWIDALTVEHKKIISIEMSDFEVRLWEKVRDLDIDWDLFLGENAVAILESGHKIELDGAMNPEIYGEAFTRWVGVRILQKWASEVS